MKLDNLLDTKEVSIEGLGMVTVTELSHKAQMLVITANRVTLEETHDHPLFGLAGPLTVKYGLSLDESAEEIAEKMPLRMIQEIAGHVNQFVIDTAEAEDQEGLAKN